MIKFFFIKAFFFLCLTFITNLLFAQEESFLFTVDLEISTDNKNYFITRPASICTDYEYNIYVADVIKMEIYKFDEAGKYLTSIGRRGRGPGEFLDFTSVYCDKNRLIIFDQMNLRVTTISYSGEILTTESMNKDIIMWPRDLMKVDGEFVVLYKLPKYGNYKSEQESKLLHVFDDTLKEWKYSFFSINEQEYVSDFEDSRFQVYPGNVALDESGRLLFIPGIYSGILYRFEKSQQQIWQLNDSVLGNEALYENAVIIYKKNEKPTGPHTTSNSASGRVTGTVNNSSELVQTLNDGTIIVIYAKIVLNESATANSKIPNHWKYVIEEYSEDLVYKGSSTFMRRGIRNPFTSTFKWKDEKDRFYFIDIQEDNTTYIKRGVFKKKGN